jgi:CheY-like chemotaxis protein
MTTPALVLPLAQPATGPLKRKKVLLVDTSTARRELRAEVMRKLGMDVDCAADITEARSWWRADLYNLVLINMENELGHRDKFCEYISGATPPQKFAFLVGKPEYLADLPNVDSASSVQNDVGLAHGAHATGAPAVDVAGPQRWGILEASRRISAVRSKSHARTRAIQERPAPPRDLEARELERTTAWSQILPELQKEERQ